MSQWALPSGVSTAPAWHDGHMTENDWYRLTLDLEEFDEGPFVAGLERHRESGIRFADFTTLGDSDDSRRKLYELNRACSRDIPNRGVFYTFEDYVAQRIEVPSFASDGAIIALDGDAWVGMCVLSEHLDHRYMFIEMTGVRADYRQRGISLAMKVLAFRFARAAGAASIRTFHSHDNTPAIRANEKLGFRPVS